MSPRFPQSFGAYALLKPLGQGAMGDVLLARPFNARRGIPTPVVIKRLHGELASNEDFVRRFQHEANVAVSVDSPHVAKVYDVGQVGETLYIAMEYVAGWPLSKFLESVIESGRHAPISAIADLIAGALSGLDALHTARDLETGQPLGVIHRDISPKNLMVGEDGQMRLIDLGLGKSNLQDWKTRTGMVMGSVGYMPPEQVTADHVDQRADLYAIGVVLWELLSLRNYIKRGPLPQMLQASVQPVYEPPSLHRPDAPRALDKLLEKALAYDPADRFQSAREFLDALRAIVPARRSTGGMASLIDDLFARILPERKSEVSALLALPLPESEDGPEQDRTVVFVHAPDVAPLTPEDFAPAPQIVPFEGTSTHVRPRHGLRPPMPTPMSMPMPMPMPEPHPSYASALPPSAIPPARSGVSLWTLLIAVTGALLLGAAGTWLMTHAESEPVEVPPAEVVRRSPAPPFSRPDAPGAVSAQPVPSAQPAHAAIAEDPEPPAPTAPTTPSLDPTPARTKRRTPGTKRTEPIVESEPSTKAPPAGAPTPSLDSTADRVKRLSERLSKRVQALSARFAKGTEEDKRLQQLLVKITMSQNAEGERAIQQLEGYDAELKRLENE
ncbi:MAG: protein kinase [Deltaproteobacteria bacterium]|nr:protein kinase [Deltaproteobacteria bacterium]